ncbi:MAG: hypothetical protein ACM31O_06125 [Bacteroidota bacterium]
MTRFGKSMIDGRSNADGDLTPSSSTVPQSLADKLKRELTREQAMSLALARTPLRSSPPAGSRHSDGRTLSSLQLARRPGMDIARLDEDDPLPQPPMWHAQPPAPRGWLAQQLRAGLLGLVLGLIGVIPTVLWLTGKLDEPLAALKSAASTSEPAKASKGVSTRAAAAVDVPPVLVNPPKQVERSATAAPEKDGTDLAEELLSRAQSLIDDGEILRAREILGDGLLADNPKAVFALAETFDPNILAATGARGVRAEVGRARMLYGQALAGGVALARQRLDALK